MSVICVLDINNQPALFCPLGKQYQVSLPICDRAPLLRDRPLIAHKSFWDGWAVTDAISGYTLCHGKTRKAAISRCQDLILKYGNPGFELAMQHADKKRADCNV